MRKTKFRLEGEKDLFGMQGVETKEITLP